MMLHFLAISLSILALMTGYRTVAEGAYLIQLKNGREFVTHRYWTEGDQIKFETAGGVLGMPKQLVRRIDPTDRLPPTEAVTKRSPEAGKSQDDEATAEETGPAGTEAGSPALEKAEPAPPKDDQIVEEFRLLRQRFGRLNDLRNEEVYRLSDDLIAFQRRISDRNLRKAHQSEFDGATTLVRAIEGLMKARAR